MFRANLEFTEVFFFFFVAQGGWIPMTTSGVLGSVYILSIGLCVHLVSLSIYFVKSSYYQKCLLCVLYNYFVLFFFAFWQNHHLKFLIDLYLIAYFFVLFLYFQKCSIHFQHVFSWRLIAGSIFYLFFFFLIYQIWEYLSFGW